MPSEEIVTFDALGNPVNRSERFRPHPGLRLPGSSVMPMLLPDYWMKREHFMAVSDPRAFLTSLFDAAVRAADPLTGILAHLPAKPKGRTIVIGAGKGSAQMAAAF